MAGWYPLSGTAAPKVSGAKKSKGGNPAVTESSQEITAQLVRSSIFLNRLVPRDDRSGGAVCINQYYNGASQLPKLSAGIEHKRVVAVLDKLGGKVMWWQLPAGPWASLLQLKILAELDVRISDATGESVATRLEDWQEVIEATKPTEQDRDLFPRGSKVGGRFLTVHGVGSMSFDCLVAMDLNGQTWEGRTTRAIHLFVPCAYGWPEGNRGGHVIGGDTTTGIGTPFFAPTIVLPYRFVIPGDVASLGTELKVEAELIKK
jgi:hypothetical protein